MQSEPLMTLAEAAGLLRLEQRKVKRLARRGQLPGAVILPSGEIRFDKGRFLAWLGALAGGSGHE